VHHGEDLLYVVRMNDRTDTASADRIDLLATFVRVVEAGSLSAAARQLGITQPSASRRLQALERQLGLRLIQRSTHSMALTEDGQRLLDRARDFVSGWDALQAELRGVRDEPEGTLRVVVPHAFGQQQLLHPLADYLRRYPRVQVEWTLHDRNPNFAAENVDCALHVGPIGDPGVVALKVAEIPRFVAISPTLLAGRRAPTRPAQLAELPWIALRQFYRTSVTLTETRSQRSERVRLRPVMSTDSLYALKNAAELGIGACIGSSWLMRQSFDAGTLVPLLPKWRAEPLPMYIVYPQSRTQPARLRRFIELMREALPIAVQ